jgi:hypothetical protein
MKRLITFLCMFLLLNISFKTDAVCPVYSTSSGGQAMSQPVEVRPPIYCTNTGGCGYEASTRAPYKFAAVAFAAVLIGAIIAVALQKKSSDLIHTHSDSTTTTNGN